MASLTTWKASSTDRTSSSWSSMALLVPVERVEGGDLDPGPERLTTVTEPGLVGLTGAARHEVEKPGPYDQVAILVPMEGQVHHPRQLVRPAPTVLGRLGRHVVPHVLVNAQDPHAAEAGVVVGSPLQHGFTESHTALQLVPSWRRIPLTEACSRRICSMAHRHALTVSLALGVAIRSSRSMNDPGGHAG
jgi:hypothetical protein